MSLGERLRRQSRALMAPFHRLGRGLYWRLPYRVRTPLVRWGYRNLGPLFRGLPEYEQWQRAGEEHARLELVDELFVDLAQTPRAKDAGGRVAIHVHLYYEDLADELAGYLGRMPFPYDLFVSVASVRGEREARRSFSSLPKCSSLVVEQVPNRGRDLAPLFCTFGSRLLRYDIVAHLHGKKSLYNENAAGWRAYLCESLFGSGARIEKIFSLLAAPSKCGLVYPQNSARLSYIANSWLANRTLGASWCARLGILAPRGYFDFPVGSMFWARVDALRPLFEADIALTDFPLESGQTDGTLAHCLERMLGLCARRQAHRIGILRDESTPSWSAWRFDQYTTRSEATLFHQLTARPIRLIAFDLFDTLLCRPLLDAESVKRIVAARAGADGATYLEHRVVAENEARERAGRDVGLDAIYARLAERMNMSTARVAALRALEEEAERRSLRPRPQAISLYRRALASGTPVVIISDTFLSRALIESCLRDHGIEGWHALYLSSEVGLRKDTGALYEHILAAERAQSPSQFIMLGDSERADAQIPWDAGAEAIHLLRPLELARGTPRARRLVEEIEATGDVEDELTLGLVLLHAYADVYDVRVTPDAFLPPTPFSIGYALVGPLLTSFAAWLEEAARRDHVERLYFLSREGELMKRAFDVWTTGVANAPASAYLVVSRRALGVPLLRTREDIHALAKDTYFENAAERFLSSRFGLTLSSARWAELTQQVKWSATRTIEIHEANIAHVMPLLDAVAPDIFAAAAVEREALLAYLEQQGLRVAGRNAVVDVGYGGTMQGHLNRLLGQPVHGYYFMTDDRAAAVAARHDVRMRGCFLEDVARGETAPLFYRHYFDLERLLSSNEAQLIRYRLHGDRPVAEHHALSEEERRQLGARAHLQEGALAYVHDARRLREQLLPGFRPSAVVARRIFETFVARPSEGERQVLTNVALDDHYCGRARIESPFDNSMATRS